MKKPVLGIALSLLIVVLLTAVLLLNPSPETDDDTQDEETITVSEPGSIDEADLIPEDNAETEEIIEEPEEEVIPVPEGKVLVIVNQEQTAQEIIELEDSLYHEAIVSLEESQPKLSFKDITDDSSLISNLNGSLNYLYANETNHTKDQVGIVLDPSSLYVLSNKLNKLPADYVPENLVIPDIASTRADDVDKRYVRQEMATALEELFAAALEENLYLFCASGYRSYETQERVYNSHVATKGQEAADKVSARPGHSEHQTGLAMDVTCEAVNYKLEEVLGELPEGIFLAEHAHEYGMIIRYPKGKSDITGYNYEPWHLRYVGIKLATFLYENELTLEEYNYLVQSQAYLYMEDGN